MGQATNTFSEGMIKDINPINVPQTALTDCKNGTIITYNGNEFSLQNDMGNCELINCKLPTGYVPVGMKEYGGILYIVSYNPVLNKTEIGSYPSTKVGAKLESGSTLQRTITYIDWDVENNYTTILKKCGLQVFTDKNPEPWKINPGDEVVLEWETEVQEVDEDGDAKFDEKGNPIMKAVETDKLKDYPCQKTEFYIMDENRNLTNIDEYIKEHLKHYTGKMSTTKEDEVRWKIPGWLAVKLCFPDLDNFLINFKLTKEPAFKVDGEPSNMSFALGFRAIMSDGLYTGNTTDPQMHVKYKIKLVSTKGTETEITYLDTPFTSEKVDMPNGQYYFNSLDTDFNDVEVKKGDKIVVTATPYIGRVEYDKFAKEFTYTADSVVFDESKVKFGENYFTYALNEDSSELKVYFDTKGMSQTTGAELYWGLYRLHNRSWTKIGINNANPEKPAYTLVDKWEIAETITTEFTINLDEYNDKFYKDKNETKLIVPEDIYKLSLKVRMGEKSFYFEDKIIVASKLMNGFSDAHYDQITFDRWFANYDKYITGDIKAKDVTCASDGTIYCDTPGWFLNMKDYLTKYTTFIDKSKNDLSNTPYIKSYVKATVKINSYDSTICFPHGPMWNDINENINVEIYIGDRSELLKINKLTGTVELPGSIVTNTEIGFNKEYTYNVRNGFNNKCFDYEFTNCINSDAIGINNYDWIEESISLTDGWPYFDTVVRKMPNNTLPNLVNMDNYSQKRYTQDQLMDRTRKGMRYKDIPIFPIRVSIPVVHYNDKYFNNASFVCGSINYIEFDGSTGGAGDWSANRPLYLLRIMPPNQKYIIFVKTTIPASTTADEEANAKIKITEITRKLAQIIKVFKRGEIKFGGFVEIKGKELASLYGDKLECTSKCSLVPSLVSFSSNKPNESILGTYTNFTGEIQNLQFSKNAYTELDIDGIINQTETLDKINKFDAEVNEYNLLSETQNGEYSKDNHFTNTIYSDNETWYTAENNRPIIQGIINTLNNVNTNPDLMVYTWYKAQHSSSEGTREDSFYCGKAFTASELTDSDLEN